MTVWVCRSGGKITAIELMLRVETTYTHRSRCLFSQHWQNVSMVTITADYSLNCLRPQVQRAALFTESSVHVIMSSRNIAADMIEASCYVL